MDSSLPPNTERMENRVGNRFPEQFVTTTALGKYYTRKRTTIAYRSNEGTVILSDDWDYFADTLRYLSIFLDEDEKTIKAKIGAGIYTVRDNIQIAFVTLRAIDLRPKPNKETEDNE